MKKTFFGLLAATLAIGLAFSACDKSEEDYNQSSGTYNPGGTEEPDITKFDVMPYEWTITQMLSDELSGTTLLLVNQAIASGNLKITFNGESTAAQNYAGREMHIAYNTTNVMTFDVVSYKPSTQEFEISYNDEIYSSVIQTSEDNTKVYMTVDAQTPLTGKIVTIVSYTLK